MLQTTDPVTREIIKNALMSAADTMALTVVRTARSAVIKHGMDFSTALWSCCIGHQTDIGGRVAGGNACDNTEIYQEGLILPPLKLYEEGELNRAVWRILEKNVRVPDKVLGDVQALLAAVRFGERDLLRLVDEYGLEEMKSYMADILDTTEALTRAEISSLPQGEWQFVDHIDNDGIDPQSIDIHVNVRIDGDEVFVDFDGTSPQAKGSINPNFAYTKSNVYAVMKCLIDPAIQSNSGFFRPFNITAPEGCFVNPQHPAPVAARGLAGFRICQAMFGAMAQALPGRVPAAWGGGEIGLSFGGYHSNRKAWVYLEFNNDGPRGGGPSIDGADGLASPVLNMANTPIESIESDQPLLVERFGLVPDTGGAGEYRGGLGIVREFRVLAEEATFQLRSDRTNFRPWGVDGGKPGTPTQNILNPGTPEEQELPGKHLMTLKKGDLYRVIQAGAGGYGNPLDRDPQAVAEDVRQQKLTREYARWQYGVVLDVFREPDMAATEELRDRLRAGDFATPKYALTPEQIRAARSIVAEAGRAFDAGDVQSGCQKLWDAASTLVAIIAQQRGWPHETPSDLGDATDLLSAEYDYEPDLCASFGAAEECLENIGRPFMKQRDIDYVRKTVPAFIDDLEKLQTWAE